MKAQYAGDDREGRARTSRMRRRGRGHRTAMLRSEPRAEARPHPGNAPDDEPPADRTLGRVGNGELSAEAER